MKNLWKAIYRVADPKISLASAASLFLGATTAAHNGPISWMWLALGILGIFSLEAAKNSSGEIFDLDSGTDLFIKKEDQSPFSGGKRVLVDQLITRTQMIALATVFYALGILIGFTIVLFHEPRVFWFGFIGVFLALFYHAPPLKLSYRGWGELAVGITYGPLIACGTYLLLCHRISLEVFFLSIPLGILIAAFLWINEFPDLEADRRANKRTLVVLLGKKRAAKVFSFLILVPFLFLAFLPLAGLPATIALGLIGLPFGILAIKRIRTNPFQTKFLIPAQKWTLLTFVLMALGTGLGCLL